MTQEQKAKAYDEALERAKKFNIDDAYTSQGTVAKLIFPELAENEDERTKKELIDTIKRLSYDRLHISEELRDKYIAWIEKQKEPHYTKRNELFDKCVENCDPAVMKEVSDKVDEMLRKEQKPNIEICPRTKSKSFTEVYMKGWNDAMKQKEQKPEGIEGVVHHYATVHYLETNTEQLNARLKDFEEGAKVRVLIIRKEDNKCRDLG